MINFLFCIILTPLKSIHKINTCFFKLIFSSSLICSKKVFKQLVCVEYIILSKKLFRQYSLTFRFFLYKLVKLFEVLNLPILFPRFHFKLPPELLFSIMLSLHCKNNLYTPSFLDVLLFLFFQFLLQLRPFCLLVTVFLLCENTSIFLLLRVTYKLRLINFQCFCEQLI